jgi:hypothetical protein
LGYGYNAGGVEKIENSFNYITEQAKEYVITPVKKLAEEVFVGEDKREADKKIKLSLKKQKTGAEDETDNDKKEDESQALSLLSVTHKATLALAKKFVDDMSVKYKLDEDKERLEHLKISMDEGKYEEFQKFVDDIKNTDTWTWRHPVVSAKLLISAPQDYVYGEYFLKQLLVSKLTSDTIKETKQEVLDLVQEKQELALDYLSKQQKQFAGVSKLVLLTPAVLTGLLLYAGYQRLPSKNYSPIRRALIDINSLFVDQSKPLDDERYGKMVYLLYNLKKLAEKDLPQKKNLRAEFLQDLEKIESKEFDVAAKRRIVDDMFRKYSFLGVVQKK